MNDSLRKIVEVFAENFPIGKRITVNRMNQLDVFQDSDDGRNIQKALGFVFLDPSMESEIKGDCQTEMTFKFSPLDYGTIKRQIIGKKCKLVVNEKRTNINEYRKMLEDIGITPELLTILVRHDKSPEFPLSITGNNRMFLEALSGVTAEKTRLENLKTEVEDSKEQIEVVLNKFIKKNLVIKKEVMEYEIAFVEADLPTRFTEYLQRISNRTTGFYQIIMEEEVNVQLALNQAQEVDIKVFRGNVEVGWPVVQEELLKIALQLAILEEHDAPFLVLDTINLRDHYKTRLLNILRGLNRQFLIVDGSDVFRRHFNEYKWRYTFQWLKDHPNRH